MRWQKSKARTVFALLSGLMPLSAMSCNADIDRLDGCFYLAGEYCDELQRCGHADVDPAQCREALGDQCIDHGDLKVDKPDECGADLKRQCFDVLPASCDGLVEDMGCDQCNSKAAPDPQAIRACCELEPLSAVCGGC